MEYRKLWVMLVLTLVTLGFYWIYWTVKTKNEIKKLGAKIPSAAFAFMPLIMMLVVPLLILIFLPALFATKSPTYLFIPIILGSVLFLLSLIFPIYFWYKYSKGFVKYVKHEPKSREPILFYTILSFLLPHVAMFVFQIDLNKLAKQKEKIHAQA